MRTALLRQLLFAHALGGLATLAACSGAPAPEPRSAEERVRPHQSADTTKKRDPELAPAQIVAGLRGSEAELDGCFESAEWAPGFVRLAWRVDTSGVTSDVEVRHSTFAEASIGECLTARLTELRFGPQAAPSAARWTFVRGLSRKAREPGEAAETRPKQRKSKRRRGDDKGVAIAPSSPGFLEPSKIEDVVHAGFGLIARCYRDGLERDPALGGAVRLTFVIDEKGRVARVVDGGSDLPDARVVDCVAEGLYALEFPRPRKGRVHVLYRVLFDSG